MCFLLLEYSIVQFDYCNYVSGGCCGQLAVGILGLGVINPDKFQAFEFWVLERLPELQLKP